MAELKLIRPGTKETTACCGQNQGAVQAPDEMSCKTCPPLGEKGRPAWVTGILKTDTGDIPVVSVDLATSEYWEHLKCRISAFRNDFTVAPGLYAVGVPDKGSDVFRKRKLQAQF